MWLSDVTGILVKYELVLRRGDEAATDNMSNRRGATAGIPGEGRL